MFAFCLILMIIIAITTGKKYLFFRTSLLLQYNTSILVISFHNSLNKYVTLPCCYVIMLYSFKNAFSRVFLKYYIVFFSFYLYYGLLYLFPLNLRGEKRKDGIPLTSVIRLFESLPATARKKSVNVMTM